MGICDERVVIVTGAARGIGRAHARLLAAEGAMVIVNDLGGKVDGSDRSASPAEEVAEEIVSAGGVAVANSDDVSDWDGARRLVEQALAVFGRLDVLVNNAGILRDRMLTNMTIQEWDAVIRVHLRGTFAPTHWAAVHWRERAKAGEILDARLINTSSASGLYGNPGQTNYGAAKAGIAAFTLISAQELGRYGVTVNAIAPGARTRMTEGLGFGASQPEDATFDSFAPENISPLVVWLASRSSAGISGRVFNVAGGRISVAEGWTIGPQVEKAGRWEAGELGGIIPDLVARAAAPTSLLG